MLDKMHNSSILRSVGCSHKIGYSQGKLIGDRKNCGKYQIRKKKEPSEYRS